MIVANSGDRNLVSQQRSQLGEKENIVTFSERKRNMVKTNSRRVGSYSDGNGDAEKDWDCKMNGDNK